MNSDEDIFKLGDKISAIYENITSDDLNKNNRLLKTWKYVVGTIKQKASPDSKDERPIGNHILSHSRLIDYKNEALIVEADHPGWLQLLQMYKTYIIRGMNRGCPELKVKSLMLKLKGAEYGSKKADAGTYNEQVRRQMQAAQDRQDELMQTVRKEENSSSKQEKKELPPELKNLFDQFRNDMLTKNK